MQKRKPKVFVIGASGFLGFHLTCHLRQKFCVSGAYFNNPIYVPDTQLYPVNLKNISMIDSLIRAQRPDFMINALGITDRELCNKQPKKTDNFNGLLPASFAMLAHKTGAKFVQISCAEVYDGHKGDYNEHDTGFNINQEFAKQKVAAETYIRTQTLESCILRIGRVIGLGLPYRQNYFDSIRFLASAKEMITASKTRVHSYLSVDSFVKAVEQVVSSRLSVKHHLLHVGGPALSEYDFVLEYLKFIGLDEKLIRTPSQGDEQRNISLNSGHFESIYSKWKAETKAELYANILRELSPGLGIKKWQTILQTL